MRGNKFLTVDDRADRAKPNVTLSPFMSDDAPSDFRDISRSEDLNRETFLAAELAELAYFSGCR